MSSDDYTTYGPATVETLEQIQQLIEHARSNHPGLPASDLIRFETAVIEVADNVVHHGRPPGQVFIEFTLVIGSDRIAATLCDTGDEFTPDLSAEMPDPDLLLESGRGLPLARKLLDELDYRREGDRNVWTMARHLADGQARTDQSR